MIETREPAADALIPGLSAKVQDLMQELHVPGVAVGMIDRDAKYAAGFGVTNIAHPMAVDDHTIFQIGSITKTFTAMLIMQLAEEGKVDLDLPVRTYVADLRLADKEVAVRVTTRHLLTHTAGWEGDYFADHGRGDDALARMVASMETLPQLTPLGEMWTYNNAAYYLAGRLIEVVTGEPWETVVKRRIFEPLGMAETFVFPEQVMVHRFAVGHNVADGTPRVATPWAIPRSCNAAGGINSTATDMLRYARFWLGDGAAADGTRLLTRESMDLMMSRLIQADEGRWVGLSWATDVRDGMTFIGHDGGTIGQIARLSLAPDREFGLVILTNCSRGSELVAGLRRWIAQNHFHVEPESEPVPRIATDEELAQYAGDYASSTVRFELRPGDGDLVTKVIPLYHLADEPTLPETMKMSLYGQERIFAKEGPMKGARGEFIRGSDGQIAWLRVSGRLYRRM